MKIGLRYFSPINASEHIERILSDAVVAKLFGIINSNEVDIFKPNVNEYIRNCQYLFSVALEDGKIIGFVGFSPLLPGDRNALKKRGLFDCDDDTNEILLDSFLEISYALDKDYIGMGIGPQAVKAAIEMVFAKECAGIVASYGVFRDIGENVRSSRLLKREGFVPLRTYENSMLASGERADVKVCYLINPIVEQKYGCSNHVQTIN